MRSLFLSIALMLMYSTSFGGTAFFKYEQKTGGLTKQCVYDYLGSAYTITIKDYQLCPLNINVGS